MPKIVITQNNIESVLKLVRMWQGKLTWDLLCEKVASELGVESIERQSLASYSAIQEAYSKKKEELREKKENTPTDYTLEYLKNKVASLEDDVARLTEMNKKYKERFVLWQHNAYINGMRVDKLDDAVVVLSKPLPALNRSASNRDGNK
ncbi:TPA: hypothetical protein ACSP1H_003447 [Aeromonas veronii]|uniref:hypothetical protein n=1 Tax=Aeromonas TaxID=642 RepID=UPI000DD01F68|nr:MULTISPECIES: hypothetical protein [Aeromonas]MCR3969062.1 hypothetical protein [Aeromonas veronii]MCR3981512.1 hypothetical protein [Aeromonas veronii]